MDIRNINLKKKLLAAFLSLAALTATGITDLSARTERQASSLEETTAALTSAQRQIEDLRQAVGFFKTRQVGQVPMEIDEDYQPHTKIPNPVADQQRTLARKVAASTKAAAATAVRGDEDWQEI